MVILMRRKAKATWSHISVFHWVQPEIQNMLLIPYEVRNCGKMFRLLAIYFILPNLC